MPQDFTYDSTTNFGQFAEGLTKVNPNTIHRIDDGDIADQMQRAIDFALENDLTGQRMESYHSWVIGAFLAAIGPMRVITKADKVSKAPAIVATTGGFTAAGVDSLHNTVTETAPGGWARDLEKLKDELVRARASGDYTRPELASALAAAESTYPYQSKYSGIPGDDLISLAKQEIEDERQARNPDYV